MAVAQISALIDFTAGTTIVSSDVDSNFDAVRTAFNNLVTAANRIDIDTIRENTSGAGVTFGHFVKFSVAGVTASATQSQGQQQLSATLNDVTVNNNGDVVTLPAASAGRVCVVRHNHLGSATGNLTVYVASGDTLNGEATPGALNMTEGQVAIFFAVDATEWAYLT